MWPFTKKHATQPAPREEVSDRRAHSGNAPNRLFLCPVSVRAGLSCENPFNWDNASVFCYVAAPDHLMALRIAVEKLKAKGWLFEDLVGGKVNQLDPQKWDEYVASTWSELPGHFPSQQEVMMLVEGGGAFFGPFCGASAENPNA
jgi:hypothetical protein